MSIELFVEILDRYVYYFDQQNESVRRLLFSNPMLKPLTHYQKGHDKVPQRPHRTHPFHHCRKSAGLGRPREQQAPLPAYAREHPQQAIRGRRAGSAVGRTPLPACVSGVVGWPGRWSKSTGAWRNSSSCNGPVWRCDGPGDRGFVTRTVRVNGCSSCHRSHVHTHLIGQPDAVPGIGAFLNHAEFHPDLNVHKASCVD